MVVRYIVVAIAAFVLWLGFDAVAKREHSLRDFDPHAVARLETATWRSYYDRRPVALLFQLYELLRTQYRLSTFDSARAAFAAARAAERFQPGHSRTDYDRALPALEHFYAIVQAGSDTSFVPQTAARLELDWWVAHRERARPEREEFELHDRRLEDALAALQAHIYGIPAPRLAEHARARSDAMLERDAKAAAGGVRADDWVAIEGLLDRSWTALRSEINIHQRT